MQSWDCRVQHTPLPKASTLHQGVILHQMQLTFCDLSKSSTRAKQAVLFSKHCRSQVSRIKSHENTPRVYFCRGFTEPTHDWDKSIHRSIYSPPEITYTVSLQKPSLRLSLTRHMSYSSSDLECRTRDPQPTDTSIWPRQSAWLAQTELLLLSVPSLTRPWQAEWEQRAQKTLSTQVYTLQKKGCFCTKPNAGLRATDVCYCAGSSNSNKLMGFLIATQPP